jgi:hypothetical protein
MPSRKLASTVDGFFPPRPSSTALVAVTSPARGAGMVNGLDQTMRPLKSTAKSRLALPTNT